MGKCTRRGEVKHDPEQLAGLATMRRPETAGELIFAGCELAAHVFVVNGRGRLASSCLPEGAYGGR